MIEGRDAPESQRTGALLGAGTVAAARSDRGPRERNEDAYVCRPDLGLFAVIDGMGGQQGGQKAAGLARKALLDEQDLRRAFRTANERIHKAARKDVKTKGMGCVASAARMASQKAVVAHVGDTRVYLAGEAGCEQLTCDHTVAARAQEEFGISARGAREIGGHNQVTRDLGGRPRSDEEWIDSFEVPLQPGDLLVLCSDGVHGPLDGDVFLRIREARRQGTPPERLADELVETALAQGGADNATAVVVQVVVDRPRKERWWARDIGEWFQSRE